MKTLESHKATATSKKSGPFFRKGRGDGFFQSARAESFFSGGPVGAGVVQTKLSIGSPHDVYEKEADAVADRVVQRLSQGGGSPEKAPAPVTPLGNIGGLKTLNKQAAGIGVTETNHSQGAVIQEKCAACEKEEQLERKEEDEMGEVKKGKIRKKAIFQSNEDPPENEMPVQRKCKHCEEEEKKVQRKCKHCEEEEKKLQKKGGDNGAVASPSVESKLGSHRAGGAPMSGETNSSMSHAFGADFSGVRIHTDSDAAQMNKELHAHAFTQGKDIYFNSGKYDDRSTEGKKLLAHELTHVVQQNGDTIRRNLWDDFKSEVSAEAHAAGKGLAEAGQAVVGAAETTGHALYDTGKAVVGAAETTGHALYGAGKAVVGAAETTGHALYQAGSAAVQGITDAASQAMQWLGSEAGQAATALADLFGAQIHITASGGLEIILPQYCPMGAVTNKSLLDPWEKGFLVPIFNMEVLPGLLLTGSLGLKGSLTPEIQTQLGPFCLEGARILIDPATGTYSVSGAISMTGAASLGAELRGGVQGELRLHGVVLVGGVPIPIDVPLLQAEGGLAGMVRGIGAGRLILGGSLTYSSGTISASGFRRLELGIGADLFAGAYAQLKVLDKYLCRIYWQPYEWHGGIGYSFDLSGGLAVKTGGSPGIGVCVSKPTMDRIPFEQIPLAISREGFSDDCPLLDRLCEILKELKLLPSQNGGSWDWSGTGHGGKYGPGPRLAGPLDVYQRDPGIASGASCRGACGPGCETCEPLPTYLYTDPVTGDDWLYTNFQDCNTNGGCREHDAAYDWAADVKGEKGKGAVIMPWHMAANIECACNNLAGNCIAWIFGLPPYDGKLYFADKADPVSGLLAQNECRETNPDFTDCTPEGSDRDIVLEDWAAKNGFRNIRNCKQFDSFPPGKIDACDGAPGVTWHCTATEKSTGKSVTISIFGCYCCDDQAGSSGLDWRSPHTSIRLTGFGLLSRDVPMIDTGTYKDVQQFIRSKRYADALNALVADLQKNGQIDASKCNIRFVNRTDRGEGLTTTNFKKNPATGKMDPDGLSEVEIYTPAFGSIQELVSTVMHEYQHVLQHQVPGQDPAKFKSKKHGGRAEEEAAVAETEAYLWEIEHSDDTGLAARTHDMKDIAGRLKDHYDDLGKENKTRQKIYEARYDKAQQFVSDLTAPPPPMPSYGHVYHHGTHYDDVEKLRTITITGDFPVDFGGAFYTHTKGNWDLARQWAIRGSMGKKGWGVVTFPIPDVYWTAKITNELIFKDTKSSPTNIPINPDTGKPFKDWKDFVDYNKREHKKKKLPDWGAKGFDVIEGPLWGSLSKTPSIHQVAFTSKGAAVLNDSDVLKLRFVRKWLFLKYR
jgi:hypothetical protein